MKSIRNVEKIYGIKRKKKSGALPLVSLVLSTISMIVYFSATTIRSKPLHPYGKCGARIDKLKRYEGVSFLVSQGIGACKQTCTSVRVMNIFLIAHVAYNGCFHVLRAD